MGNTTSNKNLVAVNFVDILKQMTEATERLVKEKAIIDEKRAEILAGIFDKLNPKTAKEIREKGLPVAVILGKKLHKVWSTGLSYYCKVYSNNLIEGESYVFSWEDYNPYKALELPKLLITCNCNLSYISAICLQDEHGLCTKCGLPKL